MTDENVNFSIRMSADLRDALGEYHPHGSAAASMIELVYAGAAHHRKWAEAQIKRAEAQARPVDPAELETWFVGLSGYRAMVASCARVQKAILAMGEKGRRTVADGIRRAAESSA